MAGTKAYPYHATLSVSVGFWRAVESSLDRFGSCLDFPDPRCHISREADFNMTLENESFPRVTTHISLEYSIRIDILEFCRKF